MGTVAVVVPHFVVTRSPIITRVVLTVVDVDAAVPPRPSVDTDTRIVSHRVIQTCCSIFTNIGIKSAFIHILLTELSYNQSCYTELCFTFVYVSVSLLHRYKRLRIIRFLKHYQI